MRMVVTGVFHQTGEGVAGLPGEAHITRHNDTSEASGELSPRCFRCPEDAAMKVGNTVASAALRVAPQGRIDSPPQSSCPRSAGHRKPACISYGYPTAATYNSGTAGGAAPRHGARADGLLLQGQGVCGSLFAVKNCLALFFVNGVEVRCTQHV